MHRTRFTRSAILAATLAGVIALPLSSSAQEGASIDKQDHAANPCGQIGETVEFDKSIELALRYQRNHPDTLVVVTADHGHTSQIVEAGTTTTGVTATLTTHDGADMTISYAQPSSRHPSSTPAPGSGSRRRDPRRRMSWA
jgi:alkaline phosphatase